MKKYIIKILLIAPFVFSACQENDRVLYSEKDAVQFSHFQSDSVIYSFAATAKEIDTVDIKIALLGQAQDYDRSYSVRVIDESSTAQKDLHYSALEKEYVMQANSFEATLPIILHSSDPVLKDSVFRIGIEVVQSEDFDIGVQERLKYFVYVTNQLSKPALWDDFLQYPFGPYSQTKHRYFIELYGIDFPATREEYTSQSGLWRSYGVYLNDFFIENYPIVDEDGNSIEPWL